MSEYGQHPLDDLVQINRWDVAICGCGEESPPCPDKAVAASFWAAHAHGEGHWDRPNLGRDLLDPVEDYVWCTDCNEPHEADLERGVLLNQSPDSYQVCAANSYTIALTLPDDWDENYYAMHAGEHGFHLYEKNPVIQPEIHCVIRPEVLKS